MIQKKITKHVLDFMEKANLFPPSGRAFLAVSGGLDSMVLMHLLKEISELTNSKLKELFILHVNHGTRSANAREEQLVVAEAAKLKLKVFVERFDCDLNLSNFETVARDRRYSYFEKHLKKGDLLYTAHHIDDSFEWAMLSSLKSSSTNSTLGIPVFNKNIARPFMSLAKKHIALYAKEKRLAFINDPSNLEERFERNFLRTIIAKIGTRFPHYLKHYANRANNFAIATGKSRISKKREEHTYQVIVQEAFRIIIDISATANFDSAYELIVKNLQAISIAKRGAWADQIYKIMGASEANKWGPLSLSGEIRCFPFFSILFFCKASAESIVFMELGQELLLFLKELTQINISEMDYFSAQKKLTFSDNFFPLFVMSLDKKMDKILPTIKRNFVYFNGCFDYANQHGIWIQLVPKLFFVWKKENNINKKFKIITHNFISNGYKIKN